MRAMIPIAGSVVLSEVAEPTVGRRPGKDIAGAVVQEAAPRRRAGTRSTPGRSSGQRRLGRTRRGTDRSARRAARRRSRPGPRGASLGGSHRAATHPRRWTTRRPAGAVDRRIGRGRKFLYSDDPVAVADDLATLVRLVCLGRLHPEVDSTRDWDRTPDVLKALLARQIRGNAILEVTHDD